MENDLYEITVRHISCSKVPENKLITKKDITTQNYEFLKRNFEYLNYIPQVELCGLKLTIEKGEDYGKDL
jgi:hypothetical protein